MLGKESGRGFGVFEKSQLGRVVVMFAGRVDCKNLYSFVPVRV